MNIAANTACIEPWIDVPRRDDQSVDRQIRAFLAGRTEGEDLLHALYDHVLDEPVPPRMLDLLRE